jgi:hypothetical protein
MSLNDEVQIHYVLLPQKNAGPIKVDKILAERLRRYRCARELRLAMLESVQA